MEIIRRITFLLILLLSFTFAIDNEFSGVVSDIESGEPLVFANIYFEGTDLGTTTNENGHFVFSEIPFEEGMLKISMMGYEPLTMPILFPIDTILNIKLTKNLIEMSSIVITGTRTERYLKDVPVTTQVIKGAKLRESGSVDVSQILNDLTGVAIVENQFGTGAELSGFGSDHILVLIDGMEILGRTKGQLDISQIPADQIERIEVVKGASSALYGSEAMGGIINIITKKPQKDYSFSISVDFGGLLRSINLTSDDTKLNRFSTNLTLTGGFNNWRSRIFANYRKYGGKPSNQSSLYLNGSKYNKYNTGFRLENPKILAGILRLDSKVFWEEQKLNVDNLIENVTDNLRLTNRLEYEGNRASIQYTTGIEYSYFTHLFEEFAIKSGNNKSSDTTIDDLFKFDMTFQIDKLQHTINGGLGYEVESIESDRIVPNSKSSNLYFGFAQNEWQVSNKSTFLAGFRLDDHSLYGTYLSPKIALMFKPEPISRIRLSYGKGFKAPTFKELFQDFQVFEIGYYIIGNPDLEPEISNSIIFDVERWHTNLYHARINIFYNKIQNLIDFKRIGYNDSGLLVWQYENIFEAITQGFDVDFTYFITPKIELAVGYSYLDAWDVDNESPINLKAKNKANLKLRFNLPSEIKFNIRSQYIGRRFFGEEGLIDGEITENWIKGYRLLHTNISRPVYKNIEINAGVNNIFDVVNEEFGPSPGREWYIGVNFNQNNK